MIMDSLPLRNWVVVFGVQAPTATIEMAAIVIVLLAVAAQLGRSTRFRTWIKLRYGTKLADSDTSPLYSPTDDAQCPSRIELGSFEVPNGKIMEDRTVIKFLNDMVFLAIFDGHGATVDTMRTCVDHVSEIFHERIVPVVETGLSGYDLERAVARVYQDVEEECYHEGSGYLNGTTACAVVIKGEKLVVTNLGDSQAILCRGGKLRNLTNLHRPGVLEERERIEREGVEVEILREGIEHEYRIGGLSVSRSFGDFGLGECCDSEASAPIISLRPFMHAAEDDVGLPCRCWTAVKSADAATPFRPLSMARASSGSSMCSASGRKPRGLSAAPDCHELTLQEDDEFVLIGCDGIFDILDNGTIMRTVRQALRSPNNGANAAAAKLIRLCQATQGVRGVLDNLSVAVAVLKRPDPVAFGNSALRRRGFGNTLNGTIL